MLLALALLACREEEPPPADFAVRPGIEIATVLDGEPGATYTLYDAAGTALVGVIADDRGQAHFAYVPDEFTILDSRDGMRVPVVDGGVLRSGGGYVIRNDDNGDWSGKFRVMGIDDPVYDWFFEGQELHGIAWSPLSGPDGDPKDGFQYIRTRDGTLLSAMVRFPDRTLYGEGPWPTVVEYSGYSPSRPDRPDAGSTIANALGFATVAVNMRGTGCSGGVFDVFNRAQHTDGYDVIEVVARQEWVLHGQVGMVGLSYPGISELYVASTNPPSLAAIVPLSTIADAWEMQWPGGIYNAGFTRTWVEEREREQEADGQSWVVQRVAEGDTVCEDNIRLSSQSIDFESFLHGLQYRPRDADDRDLALLVEQIEAPVFQGGAFQDEQTGAQFASMLDRFHSSRAARFLLYNGRHPDGYAPDAVFRWFEFLEFYLSERVPTLHPVVRLAGSAQFGEPFGIASYSFPPDRFAEYGDDYEAALAAYEAEDPVRVLFEVGGSSGGTPRSTYEATYASWPPAEADPVEWFLDAGGALSDNAGSAGADAWFFDADAGSDTFFGPSGYELLEPLWDLDWRPFGEWYVASYLTEPFASDTMVAGPGIADLWVRSQDDDVTVQVSLTEVRPDGRETLIQTGWLRLGHRAGIEDGLRIERSYSKEDFDPVPLGEWIEAEVAIPSFAHPIRAGSQLRMLVSTPGRDHGTWEFEAPVYEAHTPQFDLGRGGTHASSLRLTTLPGISVPPAYPPCPSLRGQPCRFYEPRTNLVVE